MEQDCSTNMDNERQQLEINMAKDFKSLEAEVSARGGKTWLELVKDYFPDATDEQADYILWEYTGFPGFWHLTKHYPTVISRCRQQLRALRHRMIKKANGIYSFNRR